MSYDSLLTNDLILWILLGMGVVAVLVFIERWLSLHRSRIDETDLLSGIFNNLKSGRVTESILLCEDTPGPVAHIVAEAIRQRTVPRADLQSILHSEGLSEISRMERRLSLLALIAQIAPVLGLLGTILPLLGAVLKGQAEAPLFQASTLFDALRPALLTTAAGLLVAIPAYIAFNLLVLKIDRLVLDMEHAAAEIVQFLDSHRNLDARQRKLDL